MVNSISVEKCSKEEAMDIIKDCDDQIELIVNRKMVRDKATVKFTPS